MCVMYVHVHVLTNTERCLVSNPTMNLDRLDILFKILKIVTDQRESNISYHVQKETKGCKKSY